jgi:hypothetical protein
MKRTVTFDADAEVLLGEEVRRTGLSFKEVLNRSIRRVLLGGAKEQRKISVEPLLKGPFPNSFQSRSFNRLSGGPGDGDLLPELGA